LGVLNVQRCKKTNIKSSISKVHIGNNKWETKSDEDIYPQIACKLADDFFEKLMQLKNKEKYKALERILNYIADNGYVNDTKDVKKETLDKFKRIVKDLKLIVYDITKDC
jgi:uncharacterized protein YaaR (DUF327 family)